MNCNNKQCGIVLTESNCYLSSLKRASAKCKKCALEYNKKYLKNNPDKVRLRREAWNLKYRTDSAFRKVQTQYSRNRAFTLVGRHRALKAILKRDDVSPSDLLWNFHFYSELIKDLECHYCNGTLNLTSHGLDRIQNNLGHTCYNVVPCCRLCNRIKGEYWEYEHMMLLSPKLRRLKEKAE